MSPSPSGEARARGPRLPMHRRRRCRGGSGRGAPRSAWPDPSSDSSTRSWVSDGNRSSTTSRVQYSSIRLRGDPSATIFALSITTRPVAKLLRLVHVVGGDDEGGTLLLQPVEAVPHQVASLRIETGGGLVEDHQLRLVDQRAGDGEPSLHPPGQRLHLVGAALGELDEGEQARRSARRITFPGRSK